MQGSLSDVSDEKGDMDFLAFITLIETLFQETLQREEDIICTVQRLQG